MIQQAIEFDHVCFAYRDQIVINDAQLSIDEGSFLLVVGPNGGGKTTFAKLLLGLLKPDGGHIRLFGKAPEQALQMVGYVPQMTTATERFPISVSEVVRLGLYGSEIKIRSHQRKQVDQTLEQVGLSDLAERSFFSLSGGERQRALIARALVSLPHLLILDEPTANIDQASRENIYKLLSELSGKTGIVLISHDLDAANLPVSDVLYINRRFNHRGDIGPSMRDLTLFDNPVPMGQAGDQRLHLVPQNYASRTCAHA